MTEQRNDDEIIKVASRAFLVFKKELNDLFPDSGVIDDLTLTWQAHNVKSTKPVVELLTEQEEGSEESKSPVVKTGKMHITFYTKKGTEDSQSFSSYGLDTTISFTNTDTFK